MRRDFLKLLGSAGLGLALPVFADESNGRAADPMESADSEGYGGPYYVVFNS